MTEAQTALARRVVACKGWRWMLGMRWIVIRTAPLEDYAGRIVEGGRRAPDGPGLPDLTDPATVGCLLALVREAWGNKHLWVEVGVDPAMWSLTVYSIGWACVDGEVPIPPDIQAEGEAEALVAALESAP